MIAMWGANSFEMMQKLLGPFSGRSLRGSQNMCMAKQLKPIEGHIAQINAPRFAEDRNMWVMMVKENALGFYFFTPLDIFPDVGVPFQSRFTKFSIFLSKVKIILPLPSFCPRITSLELTTRHGVPCHVL